MAGTEQPRTFLDGDLIHEIYVGKLTPEQVDVVAGQGDALIEGLLEREKPILFLVDASRISATTSAANERVKYYLSTRYFDKVAIFGLPPFLHVIANLVTKASGRGAGIHFFPDRDRAIDWLRS